MDGTIVSSVRHPPREAGESLASYPSTWLGCFPSPISRLNELQTAVRWLTHLSNCPLRLSLNHCSFMHPPTHTLAHLQAVWTLLCAQCGHCRLQTSDGNIRAITLIQYLLHGVKWRGEIKKAKQVPVKNQHVGPKWWPGAHNVETESQAS